MIVPISTRSVQWEFEICARAKELLFPLGYANILIISSDHMCEKILSFLFKYFPKEYT